MNENSFEQKIKNKLQTSAHDSIPIPSIEINADTSSEVNEVYKAKRRKKDVTLPKVGMTGQVGMTKASFMKRYYQRRRILEVPEEILEAHPDKHFVYLNMPKLERSGMWHAQGYKLFKANEDKDPLVKTKFATGTDGLIHRNEMVLGWIPKEEHEMRMLEQEMIRGRDLTDIIKKNPVLDKLSVYAESKTEIKNF